MSLNYLEIDAILAELPLEGSYIQKVRQPDFKSLVLDLYRPKERYSILVSLNQGKTRIHRLSQKVPATKGLQRFAQFLRSRVQGGQIVEAYQAGSDRIIKLRVHKGDDETVLWIRLWGGAANIIATDPAGTILDAFYRRPKRGEVSGAFYNPEEQPPKPGGNKHYEARDLPGEGSFNERVERHYADLEGQEELATLKTRALKAADEKIRSAETLCSNLERRLESYGSYEEFREYGDLLKSNLYRIHRGDQWFETENYFRDGAVVRIELDTKLSAEQNAEGYYKKYKKMKRGMETLRDELHNARANYERLTEERETLSDCEDPSRLREYLEDRKAERKTAKTDELPGLVYSSGGYILRVGRTSKENDVLLRHWARGNDYWVHARDWPGAYVFIRTKKDKSVPLDVLLDAAHLAFHYSRGRPAGRGDLYYTRVKYLRRAKDGKLGLVIPTMEKNLTVNLEENRLARLFGGSDKNI